jgi:hypothetical protein
MAMAASLTIGLVAYHAVGNLAFVHVPSERGRYLLTDISVIVVACPRCDTVIGDPRPAAAFITAYMQAIEDIHESGVIAA